MRGYAQSVIEANQKADPRSIGVKLGALCIALKIPASKVAEDLAVSKQAIYDWFSGNKIPAPNKEDKIFEMIDKLSSY